MKIFISFKKNLKYSKNRILYGVLPIFPSIEILYFSCFN